MQRNHANGNAANRLLIGGNNPLPRGLVDAYICAKCKSAHISICLSSGFVRNAVKCNACKADFAKSIGAVVVPAFAALRIPSLQVCWAWFRPNLAAFELLDETEKQFVREGGLQFGGFYSAMPHVLLGDNIIAKTPRAQMLATLTELYPDATGRIEDARG